MKNNNITLINPYVWENFWEKSPDFKSVAEAKTAYDKFVSEHQDVISKINEMLENGDYTAIKEQYGYDVEGTEMVNEVLGKKRSSSPAPAAAPEDDGFAEDKPFVGVQPRPRPTPSSKPVTADDIEAAEASKNITIIPRQRPALKNVDIKKVRNIDFDCKSMNDIHFCVQSIYQKLLKSHQNYKVITPLSLLDTNEVTEMDALFAFMDIPNVDLSYYDTSNVKNMEGMFYKSSFNNDSIKNWDVSNVNNMRNMFIGSGMTHEEYIAGWYPNTINHALPKIGVDVQEEMDSSTAVDLTFGSDEEIEQKYKKLMGYQNESWHVMSSDEFIAEGKVGDFLKRGAQKLKEVFGTITIKLKDGVTWIFDRMGEMLNVITPETAKAVIDKGAIPGVSLANKWQPSGDDDYYGYIEKGSDEYNNYLTFLNYAKKGGVNEARVTMSSNLSLKNGVSSPNINAEDWDSAKLKEYIIGQVELTQKDPEREKSTLVIWGAPGIGKSSIPKTIISDFNENLKGEANRMAIIVADCSQMPSDGFTLPTPAKQLEISKIVKSRAAAKVIAELNHMTDEELDSIEYKVSADAPKTWLPCFRPTGEPEKDEVLNALANGYVTPKYKKGTKRVIGYEVTGSGGILLIDEFLRAKRDVFFTVCQIMFDYALGGGTYVLGDKWQVIAASNRPSDDNEVRQNFASAASAGFNRLRQCNFVPSFADWKSWAEKNGFDETTLSFISGKGYDSEDSRWHNFDPELKNAKNQPRFASPRSWSDAIKALMEECELKGYTHYAEIPKSKFRQLVAMCLPTALADDYTDYYFLNNSDANPYAYDKIVENPKIVVKDRAKYKCAQAAEAIVTTVRMRYDSKHRIPVDEFVNIMIFFCNNYPDSSDVIYTELYKPIIAICGIEAPKEATQEELDIEQSYSPVDDVFAEAFPVFVSTLGGDENE